MDIAFVIILFLVGTIVLSFVLYLIIKAAVRDGIMEAKGIVGDDDGRDTVSKIKCPSCGKEYEMDCPKCPFCGHVNFE